MASQNDRSTRLQDVMPVILEHLQEGKSVVFSPRGTSMLPLLRQGRDSVELSPAPAELRRFDLPLYLRENGQYVLHRVIKTGEAYTCMGDNQFQPEFPVFHRQVLALVTAVYRDKKRIPVTALSYRIYSALWHCSRPLRHLYRRTKHAGGSLLRRLGLRK